MIKIWKINAENKIEVHYLSIDTKNLTTRQTISWNSLWI
jgi:hypothetical protein